MIPVEDAIAVLIEAGYTVTAEMPEGRFDGFVGPPPGESVTIPYMVELTITSPGEAQQ